MSTGFVRGKIGELCIKLEAGSYEKVHGLVGHTIPIGVMMTDTILQK